MSKEVRLGLFIVLGLAILCCAIFLIGNKETRFKSTYIVKAQFQNVAGLNNGADVRVGGIRKGTVKSINLPKRPDGKVTVTMSLESATDNIVKKDSLAAIKSEGLLGDKYVEISFGSVEGEKVKNGDTIGSEPPFEMSNMMAKASQLLDTAQTAVASIGESADHLQSISAKIDQGRGSVGALINDKSVYNQANKAATDLQENMEALKHNFLVRGFFKKRGYEDRAELTKNLISKLPATPAMKTFSYDQKQIFDIPDTAKLKNQKTLNDAGKYLEQTKFGLVVISAYAGTKGDSKKDQELSEARPAVVRDYLVNNFKVDDTRIKTIGLGKASTPEESGKVQIAVYPVGTSAPATPPQAPAPSSTAPH
jgi:phospholipid/cholesterol/gamma-HCH transport system substrate-binding protein